MVIAIPATGTQPSSMRRRMSSEAVPKPVAIPKVAAIMNFEAALPNPDAPPVISFATVIDHRLMKPAKAQMKAIPKEVRRRTGFFQRSAS